MVEVDGTQGEGGGQILRSALALSIITGKPTRLVNVRAGRPRPGLQRQHLAAVRAAATVAGATVAGDELGSRTLCFEPGAARGGDHAFATGSAGSCTLVLQTVLLPLLLAPSPSRLTLEGGTHNPWAPPYEFLSLVFLPLLRRMGARVTASLVSHGFYPAGGGCLEVHVEPSRLMPLHLAERGKVLRCRATAILARLPRRIAERELATLRTGLGLEPEELTLREVGSPGPGNVVLVQVDSERLTEVCTACGEKGVPAEHVAGAVAAATRTYIDAGVPVGAHLADQLLLPLAVAGGGSFVTLEPTAHTRTNAEVVRTFLDSTVSMTEIGAGAWEIRVEGGSGGAS